MKPATEKLLEKAARSIRAAERLLKDDDMDFATSRAYYAMLYVAEALLNERALRFKKHGGVHAAFAQQFIKTHQMDPKFHRWMVDAFDERIQGDYDVESAMDAEEVTAMIERAREFLQEAQRFLASQP
jgi:uncharacterized protein (UPF0332 family)